MRHPNERRRHIRSEGASLLAYSLLTRDSAFLRSFGWKLDLDRASAIENGGFDVHLDQPVQSDPVHDKHCVHDRRTRAS